MARRRRGKDEMYTPAEAAAYVGTQLYGRPYALGTFYNLRWARVMAEPDEIVRTRPRWSRSTLDRWVAGQKQLRVRASASGGGQDAPR